MRSFLTITLTFLLTLLILSIGSRSSANAFILDPRQLLGTGGLLDGVLGNGAATTTGGTGAAPTSAAPTTPTSQTTTTSEESTQPTISTTPTTTSSTPRTTPTTTTSRPATPTQPTQQTSAPTTIISTTESPSSTVPVVVTTIVTRTSGNSVFTEAAESTNTAAAASASASSASLSSGSDSNKSSGLSSQSKKTIIGVVCGIGGAIILAALGVLAWRIWGRRKDEDEDDLYDPNATNHLANDEKSRSAALASDANPFKRTLDQYHNPGPVNTASNF